MLGDPKYIQILVNPDDLILVIKCACHKDMMIHRVVNLKNDTKQCYELYSRYLINALCKLCPFWEQNDLYKSFGEVIVSEGIARFDLNLAFRHLAQEDGSSE